MLSGCSCSWRGSVADFARSFIVLPPLLTCALEAAGKVTEAVLEEAFAVLREAVWRVLELWYFDVQLLGGLVLCAEVESGSYHPGTTLES
eukprot:2647400-Amphidinium_carterae.1